MAKKIRLLLVEDERMLAEILSDTLSDRDFEVRLAFDGLEALEQLRHWKPEVIVADVMMPRMDGFTLVRRLRSEGCEAPVLFLTARSSTEDVVKGFESGGNDYLKKPFAIDELIVRVRALAARFTPTEEGEVASFQLGLYTFNPTLAALTLGDKTEKLPTREAEVLLRLCQRMGRTVESATLLRELWGDDSFFNLRSLNVFISRLRHRLAHDKRLQIVSIRGVGYRLLIQGSGSGS